MPLEEPRRSLRRLVPALVLGLGALLPVPAAAGTRLASLEVVLWPEYDRPEILVMLRAMLPADVPLPALVELPMPSAAGAPHAVAKQGPDGRLVLAQHTVEEAGDWSTVRLLTDTPAVRLEYYAPLPAGPQRRYLFTWPSGFEIDQLSYEVLHPLGASNMTVTPPADGVFQADGLTFYGAVLGKLSASESFTVELAYAKPSSELSSPAARAQQQAAPPAAPAPAAATKPPRSPIVTGLWVVAGLAIVAALVAVVSALRRPPASG
ncbi:MAG: hypothetical protein OEP45_11755 [Acidobacteriota bacterium]|nr:hypothetical protein [Acidobacteriota bacterium]